MFCGLQIVYVLWITNSLCFVYYKQFMFCGLQIVYVLCIKNSLCFVNYKKVIFCELQIVYVLCIANSLCFVYYKKVHVLKKKNPNNVLFLCCLTKMKSYLA